MAGRREIFKNLKLGLGVWHGSRSKRGADQATKHDMYYRVEHLELATEKHVKHPSLA